MDANGELYFMVLDHAKGEEDAYQRLGLARRYEKHLTSGLLERMEVSDFTIV